MPADPSPLGVTTPDRGTFRALALGDPSGHRADASTLLPGSDRGRRSRRVIPVTRRLLADAITPVGLYATLAGGRSGTFLLESAEHGRSWSRWSFVGAASRAALTESGGQATWLGTVPAGLPTGGDPLRVLADTLRALHTERLDGLPPLTGGLVGYLGYDMVRRMERVGADGTDRTPEEIGAPELVMLLATDLAALDHHEGTVTLIANAINWDGSDDRVDDAYDDAVARLDTMAAALARPAALPAASVDRPEPDARRRTASADYHRAVTAAQEYIRAGDAFQVVVSQRFDVDLAGAVVEASNGGDDVTSGGDDATSGGDDATSGGDDATSGTPAIDTATWALRTYRILRATNPSPYMYLLHLPTPDGGPVFVVGSSPEALVTVHERTVTMHPIAGTRPRGATEEDDTLLAKDLLADEKERSEHVMLVDLGRNDLGRVCAPGSVQVTDFFSIERYSHVMHIVSTVTGTLADGRTALDAVTSCFPAGTLSGAPKPRALQIIEELEPARRGPYGGIVGYLDFAGDADTAIAIRTAVLRAGTAHVQAGAGVVADSVPENEDAECRNKAAAVLGAIAAAGTWRAVR